MKNLNSYIVLILIAVFAASCGDPAPTELAPLDNTEETIVIEQISPTPGEVVYATGYDSTGIWEPVPPRASIVNITGVKYTNKNGTLKLGYAYALFSDKSRPMFNPFGRLIGYPTRYVGRISFNSDTAAVLLHRIKYFDRGGIRDTLAGVKYVYSFNRNGKSFPYGENVDFKLDINRSNIIEFPIPAPEEITGKLVVTGSRSEGNLRAELNWTAVNGVPINIIVGGVLKSTNEYFPVYRIKVKDTGKLKIPQSLLKSFPFHKFDKITFTLIRRYIKDVSTRSIDDNYIIAQSIHNISIDIP